MARKTMVTLDKTTAQERASLASWIADRISEMEPDERSINEECGRRFMATLRGLEAHLRADAPGER